MPQGQQIVSNQADIPNLYQSRYDRQYLAERGKFGAMYIDQAQSGSVIIPFPLCGVSEIFACSALVIDTLTGSIKGDKVESGGESLPVPVGTSIKGQFTSIKLTSGKALCYLSGTIDTSASRDETL